MASITVEVTERADIVENLLTSGVGVSGSGITVGHAIGSRSFSASLSIR